MKGISERVPYLLFTRLQIDEAESDALSPLDFQSKNLLFLLSSFYQLLLDLLSLLFWRLTASTSNKYYLALAERRRGRNQELANFEHLRPISLLLHETTFS